MNEWTNERTDGRKERGRTDTHRPDAHLFGIISVLRYYRAPSLDWAHCTRRASPAVQRIRHQPSPGVHGVLARLRGKKAYGTMQTNTTASETLLGFPIVRLTRESSSVMRAHLPPCAISLRQYGMADHVRPISARIQRHTDRGTPLLAHRQLVRTFPRGFEFNKLNSKANPDSSR